MTREWLKYIDLNLLDIYPIQFANCDRLLKNDAVYIFDEVGSGKTISSGLMALDFLSNSEGKVLVITTNALYKKGLHSEHGQFLKDWFEKLPFKALDLESRIEVTNNHYSHFSQKAEYGLVIIDEAQLFLNMDSLRYNSLVENILTQKVVFLTATPIKNSKCDLQVYVNIAKNITGKEIINDWINDISSSNKQPKEIICNTFDSSFPVTRYFKDTIMSLNVKGYEKSQARRLLPHLWQYGQGKTKELVLLENINSKYNDNTENKFVIFTRFVEKEACKIANYLKENGFTEYNINSFNLRTYAVVTGENAFQLYKYSGTTNLPTVLILTYQIAEQGVNLPGYNHVVNYHISAYPSALEQRFGRIDRMGKNGNKFTEINMCFLIAADSWDTNTWNFYCAISIYLQNLISYLPSKNTILSKEVLEQYSQTQGLIDEYIGKITKLINQDDQIKLIIEYYKKLNDPEVDITRIEWKCDNELFNFIEENSIEFNTDINETEAIKLLRKEIRDTFTDLKSNFGFKNGLSIDKYADIIESVSDKIFYSNEVYNAGIFCENLRTLDAINDCGENINSTSEFSDYRKKFQENVKLPILMSNYLWEFNFFFEDLFNKNNFNDLFPFNSYKSVFRDLLNKKFSDINIDDKNIILKNCEIIVKTIPFFKMCNEFKKSLQNMVYTNDGSIRIRFNFNPFYSAIRQIGNKIKQDDRRMGLSEEFLSLYWTDKINNGNLLKMECNDGVAQASNWYKLSYHYTRREEACFINRSNLSFNTNENLFYVKEKYLKYLGENYKAYHDSYAEWNDECYNYDSTYKTAMDGESADFDPQLFLKEIGYYGEPECSELINSYENILKRLIKLGECIATDEKDKHQSLFNHFIFTESDDYRTHSFKTKYYVCMVYVKDFWTQGIFFELHGKTFEDCNWGNFLKLPDKAANMNYFN